jgi:hypothetical protein
MAIFVPRFRRLADAIKKNPKLVLDKLQVAKPSKKVEALAKTHKLDPKALAFWKEADGLVLEWHEKDGEATGRIEILPLERVLGDWKEVIWFDFTPEDDLARKLHPLDFFQPEACAAIVVDGAKSPKVVYHYCGEDTSPLGVDIPGYLELLLRARGFSYWQTAIASDLSGEEEMTTSPAEFRDRMPELFPDFKLSDVLRRAKKTAKRDKKRASAYETERAELIAALEAAGAKFELENPRARSGYINIAVKDRSAPNLKKLEAGLTKVHGFWKGIAKKLTSKDFGSQSVGSVSVEKK